MATAFAQISNVGFSSTTQAFSLTFQTDVLVVTRVDWRALSEAPNPGSAPAGGSSFDPGPRLQHSFTFNLGAGHEGQTYQFGISLDSSDVTGRAIRPYIGTVSLRSGRTPLPVEFHGFTVTPPVLNYTWAQYNPNGTTNATQVPSMVAGPSRFDSLTSVTVTPAADATSVLFNAWTEQALQLRYRIWREDRPELVIVGNEAGAVAGQHKSSFSLASLGAAAELKGEVLSYEILSTTAPPPTLRPYGGSVRIPGARDLQDIPVRFYSFSGPMTAAVPALGVQGNWSRYTWSQWNSKGT